MTTELLPRPGGGLAYELTGDPQGPLVVLSPGMGDLRSTFTALAAGLAADGARVATADLRGHGDSTAGWPDYSVGAVADDVLALIHHLAGPGGRAVLVGSSYSGSAAVVAAARDPEAVAGLVLSGAFVRDHPLNALQRATFALLGLPGLGLRLWTAVAWPSFFKRRPADFAPRKAELRRNLAEPGRYAAVTAMTRPGGHAATEPELPKVTAPALVVMGAADPDFSDPGAEARFTADSLGGDATVLMVDGVGHYPHAEAPETVTPAVVDFVRKVA
jgi:pimeloyl-ACP methyl ester carboxylesterase